jgi:hypothetical protein
MLFNQLRRSWESAVVVQPNSLEPVVEVEGPHRPELVVAVVGPHNSGPVAKRLPGTYRCPE